MLSLSDATRDILWQFVNHESGRKTASVVMVQAFGVPAFPVDTHIHRLALRWGLTKYDKNPSKCVDFETQEGMSMPFFCM